MAAQRRRTLIWHLLGLWLLATWLGLAVPAQALAMSNVGPHAAHALHGGEPAAAPAHAGCDLTGCWVGCAALPTAAATPAFAPPRPLWRAEAIAPSAGHQTVPELRPPIA